LSKQPAKPVSFLSKLILGFEAVLIPPLVQRVAKSFFQQQPDLTPAGWQFYETSFKSSPLKTHHAFKHTPSMNKNPVSAPVRPLQHCLVKMYKPKR